MASLLLFVVPNLALELLLQHLELLEMQLVEVFLLSRYSKRIFFPQNFQV